MKAVGTGRQCYTIVNLKVRGVVMIEDAKNSLKALIWDMGGVLLRTEDEMPRMKLAERLGTTRRALERLVFASPSADRAMRGEIPVEEHWEEVARTLHLSDEGMVDFQKEFWAGDRIDDALVGTIRTLRSQYRTALLSNAWSDIREAAGKRFRFLDAFDVVVFSAEVKLAKPDERIYRYVLGKLAIEPHEAVFVDDFIENIEAAESLGIHTIHFKSQEQTLLELGEWTGRAN